MTSWNSYPKIWALGSVDTINIFKSEVVIEEKIDGSQFSFGVFDGKLKARSRGKEINIDSPEGLFSKAIDTVKRLEPILRDGWTYRGEVLAKEKHNCLVYGRVPSGNIILFDINSGLEQYLPPLAKESEAERLCLEMVPRLFTGIYTDPLTIPELIKAESCLGKAQMEGVVIKNYSMRDRNGNVLMAKYVSENFKEVHKQDFRGTKQGVDIMQLISNSLRTEARWHKAVQHLRDGSKLEHSPRDIGAIIKELHSDLEAECADYIKDKLYEWAFPQIAQQVKCGMPEWYKELLVKNAFQESL